MPIVAITGQVAAQFIGKDAFQETDVTGITQPITKHNYLVTEIDDLPYVFKEAFHIARTGRPGPVLIDVAKDAQQARMAPNWPDQAQSAGLQADVRAATARQIREAIKPDRRGPEAADHGRPRRAAGPAPSPSCASWPSARAFR